MRIATCSLLMLAAVIAAVLMTVGCGESGGTITSPLTIYADTVSILPNEQVVIRLRCNKGGATYSITVDPAHGTIENPPTWNPPDAFLDVTFTPEVDYRGLDSFTFTVTTSEESGFAVINIEMNTPPVLTGPKMFDKIVVDPDTFFSDTFDDPGVDPVDADGDALTFHISGHDPSKISLNEADGSFIYTPGSFAGVDTFNLWVEDGYTLGKSDEITVYIGVNDTPPDGITAHYYVYEDKGVIITLEGSDPDIGDSVMFEVRTVPANGGTATMLDADAGTLKYSAPNSGGVNDPFTFIVTDGVKESSEITIDVDVIESLYFSKMLVNGDGVGDPYDKLAFVGVVNSGVESFYRGLLNEDPIDFNFEEGTQFPLNWEMVAPADDNEGPLHMVTLTPYEVSRCEVTNAQFVEFLNDINALQTQSAFRSVHVPFSIENGLTFDGVQYPYYFTASGGKSDRNDSRIEYEEDNFSCFLVIDQESFNYPVVNVSWFGAYSFCQWLTQKDFDASGKTVSLPTEAQWEYVAHGMTDYSDTSDYAFHPWTNIWGSYVANGAQDDYSKYWLNFADIIFEGEKSSWAWVIDTPDAPSFPERISGIMPVASYSPTGVGVYDILGNVWEYCLEEYSRYYYADCLNSMGGAENWNSPILIDPPFNGPPIDSLETEGDDQIIPQDVGTDKVTLRGGSWSNELNTEVDFGDGLDRFPSGECELWRVTDRVHNSIPANIGYNKIGFRIVRYPGE